MRLAVDLAIRLRLRVSSPLLATVGRLLRLRCFPRSSAQSTLSSRAVVHSYRPRFRARGLSDFRRGPARIRLPASVRQSPERIRCLCGRHVMTMPMRVDSNPPSVGCRRRCLMRTLQTLRLQVRVSVTCRLIRWETGITAEACGRISILERVL